jgi:RNA polymerase-associated protein LEO1
MSSLAGALDDYLPQRSSQINLKHEDGSPRHDIEMYSPTSRVEQEPVKKEDLKQRTQGDDAEMDDLFGNDEDVEEAQPATYVLYSTRYIVNNASYHF